MCKEPASSSTLLFEKHMRGGENLEKWRSDFEADMFAEVAGGDDLGDAEVQARDGATGGAGEGPRADVPA
eukprot:634850-Hanusia_phi.AAC.1